MQNQCILDNCDTILVFNIFNQFLFFSIFSLYIFNIFFLVIKLNLINVNVDKCCLWQLAEIN